MEPEEIEALIAAERAKSISDEAILSRLRFQGVDATEYLKKKRRNRRIPPRNQVRKRGIRSLFRISFHLSSKEILLRLDL
jgi:hypothetical protein